MIDELENISENQQRLIQTLIREKNTSCTFRIGARLYGVRTYKTLGSGEENRKGSEFDEVVLDDFLRCNTNYNDFVRNICEHRLRLRGYLHPQKKIDDFIESFNCEKFLDKLKSKKPSQGKSYLNKLKDKLKAQKLSDDDIGTIIANLSSGNIIIERTNVLLFYREWNKKKNLLSSSNAIRDSALKHLENPANKENSHKKVLDKYKRDIIDMLARETRENIPYYGFEEFIKMSSGTPRNLLNILKHSCKWTYFNKAQEAFRDNTIIDFDVQTKGIKDTIDWFFEDNRAPIMHNGKPFECVERMGKFLRELKYSDTPPECSINVFGLNLEDMSVQAQDIFCFLEKYSYIIKTEDRRDKNSNDKYSVYYINGTIAPYWELSLSKRGVIILAPEEAESIFNLNMPEEFEEILNKKKQGYNAPFGRLNNSTPDLFEQNGGN